MGLCSAVSERVFRGIVWRAYLYYRVVGSLIQFGHRKPFPMKSTIFSGVLLESDGKLRWSNASKAPNFRFHCRKRQVGAGESAEIG